MSLTEPLSRRQSDTLRAIALLMERYDRTPSGPELAEQLGVQNASTVYEHLQALVKKGYIEVESTEGKRANTIRLLGPAKSFLRVGWPLLGFIPAGPLTEAVSDDTVIIETIEDLIPDIRKGDFFLEVEGESMVEAGLEPGMWVQCRPGGVAKPGAVCAVWVEGEGGTLKAVYPEGKKVRLQPANKDYEPRVIDSHLVRVQGVVVHAIDVRAVRLPSIIRSDDDSA